MAFCFEENLPWKISVTIIYIYNVTKREIIGDATRCDGKSLPVSIQFLARMIRFARACAMWLIVVHTVSKEALICDPDLDNSRTSNLVLSTRDTEGTIIYFYVFSRVVPGPQNLDNSDGKRRTHFS